MRSRRIIYGVVLLAALALQIFYDGYLGQFLLVCTLALPLLSLALSLRGMLGVRLALIPAASQMVQGQEGTWQISVTTRSFLPVARVSMILTQENALTGAVYSQRLSLSGLSQGMVRPLPMEGSHCGLLTGELRRVRALDALGLFAFPVPAPDPVHILVLPKPLPWEKKLPPLPQVSLQDHPTRGSSPSIEDYELREYRPGDPLRAIHWKLSSKHDSLVVREPAKSGQPQAAVTLDLYGDGDRLDRVLGRLWTVSHALLEQGMCHTILWLDPVRGQQEHAVVSHAQLLAAMAVLLSHPAPAQPSSVPLNLSRLGQIPRLHITAGEEDAP